MEDFETIYKTDMVFGDYLKCNHCGGMVERGILNVSHHWLNCLKRTDGLVIAKTDSERKILDSWSLNVNDGDEFVKLIKSQFKGHDNTNPPYPQT